MDATRTPRFIRWSLIVALAALAGAVTFATIEIRRIGDPDDTSPAPAPQPAPSSATPVDPEGIFAWWDRLGYPSLKARRWFAPQDGEPADAVEQAPPRRRSSPSWGRMIAKVYQVDPLLGARCGQRMSIVGFVTDSVAIGRILDHLGLSSPQRQENQIQPPIGRKNGLTSDSPSAHPDLAGPAPSITAFPQEAERRASLRPAWRRSRRRRSPSAPPPICRQEAARGAPA